jgi:hypothetical protein
MGAFESPFLFGIPNGMAMGKLARILDERALEREMYTDRQIKTTLSTGQFEAWQEFCNRHNERSEDSLKQLVLQALERARLYGEFEKKPTK